MLHIPWFCNMVVSHRIEFCICNVCLGPCTKRVLFEVPKLSSKIILHTISGPQKHNLKWYNTFSGKKYIETYEHTHTCDKITKKNTGMVNTKSGRMITFRLRWGGCDFGEVCRAPRYWLMSVSKAKRIYGCWFYL